MEIRIQQLQRIWIRTGSGMKLALAASNGLGWTKLEFLDSAMTTGDQESLNYVGDAFRFGQTDQKQLST